MYMLTIEKPPEGTPLRLPREGLAATYRERLAGFGGPVAEQRELIVDDDAVVYRPVENVVVPAPWYRDNVVLIGDAAHATSPHCGQGAAQAIEDALVLTQELQRARRRSAPRSTRSWGAASSAAGSSSRARRRSARGRWTTRCRSTPRSADRGR